MTTRILIGDDHPVVRGGLRRMLERVPGFEVVGEATDGAEAVVLGLTEDVDMVILDVAMPRKTGLQAAEELTRARPGLPVLMLSMYENEQYLIAAIRAGASGYVLKSEVDEEIVEVCRAVLSGAPFVYPASLPETVRAHLERVGRGSGRDELLTARELEVLKLVAEGRSAQEIAELLVISVKTVDRHRSNIMDKLGVRDRVQLTRYAIRRGLVEP